VISAKFLCLFSDKKNTGLFNLSIFLKYFLRIILLFLFSCNQKQETTKDSSNDNYVHPVIFFLASGYGSNFENISTQELLKSLKNDSSNTYILSNVSRLIKPALSEVCWKLVKSVDEVKFNDSTLFLTDLGHLTANSKALEINGCDFFENPAKYPLSTSKIYSRKLREKITLFCLTGVTAITRGLCSAIENKGRNYLIKELLPYFEKADFVHVSNEVSLVPECKCEAATMRFCSNEEEFKLLKDLHCNIIELTGNHNRDYGDKAFRSTLKWYEEQKMKTFGGGPNPEGANTPLIIKLKDGTTLGLIGFNEACPNGECADVAGECGANRYDTSKARKVIAKMRNELKCNYIIASVQFSEWDTYYPSPTQKKITRQLLQYGADLAYGSQAHQVQQIAFVGGKPIIYGLGNFLFDQMHKIGLRQAFFLQLYFYNGKLIQARPVFTFRHTDQQQTIAASEEARAIKKEIFIDSLLYGK
jgi:poly-gamma-glutamate capsule biosynthesis protein CapA/YwtB (metallophosphatase superfamily)